MFRLTTDISDLTTKPIYDPFNQTTSGDKSDKSDFNINFNIELLITNIFKMHS